MKSRTDINLTLFRSNQQSTGMYWWPPMHDGNPELHKDYKRADVLKMPARFFILYYGEEKFTD